MSSPLLGHFPWVALKTRNFLSSSAEAAHTQLLGVTHHYPRSSNKTTPKRRERRSAQLAELTAVPKGVNLVKDGCLVMAWHIPLPCTGMLLPLLSSFHLPVWISVSLRAVNQGGAKLPRVAGKRLQIQKT